MKYKITHSAKGFLQQKKSELNATMKKERGLAGYSLEVQRNKEAGIKETIKSMEQIETKRKGLLSYGV